MAALLATMHQTARPCCRRALTPISHSLCPPRVAVQDRKCPLCRTVMLFPLKTGGLPSEPFIASQADRGLTFAAEQNEKESDALGVYQALKGVFRLIPEESRDRWFEVLEATCDQLVGCFPPPLPPRHGTCLSFQPHFITDRDQEAG